MGVPISEFGCTSTTTRRGDNEVFMDMWWHWKKIFKQHQKLNWLIYFRKTAEDHRGRKFSKLFFTDHERKPEAGCQVGLHSSCLQHKASHTCGQSAAMTRISLPRHFKFHWQSSFHQCIIFIYHRPWCVEARPIRQGSTSDHAVGFIQLKYEWYIYRL
jgi:hypothetical protein